MRMKVRCLVVLLFSMSISSSAACQVVMGRVRDKFGGGPLRLIEVALVAESTAVSAALTRTTTDTGGVFYLDVPKAGTYRVAFMLLSKTMLSEALTVGEGDVQREFVVDVGEQPTYFEFQVEQPVRPLPHQPIPGYPESMRSSGIQGEVLAQFVVDTTGHADMSTLRATPLTSEKALALAPSAPMSSPVTSTSP